MFEQVGGGCRLTGGSGTRLPHCVGFLSLETLQRMKTLEHCSGCIHNYTVLYCMLLGDIFTEESLCLIQSNPLFKQAITSFSRVICPRGQHKYCYNKQIVISRTKQEQSGRYLAALCQNHQWQKQYLLTWQICLFAT